MEKYYWIGGCPSGGKSTIAQKISEAAKIELYHTDDLASKYDLILNPQEHPNIYKMNHTNFDEFIMLPDDVWLNTFIAGMKEISPVILSDIKMQFAGKSVIIEGGELLPEFMYDYGIIRHAILVNPTYEYLCDYLPRQVWVRRVLSFLNSDEYKSLFLRNLIRKYNLYREYLIDSAKKYDVKTIVTSAQNSLIDNLTIVTKHFSLS